METEEKEFLIDIDQIIKDKAGDKAKYIPGFVVSWLKRTLHQDEVNRFLGGRAKGKDPRLLWGPRKEEGWLGSRLRG